MITEAGLRALIETYIQDTNYQLETLTIDDDNQILVEIDRLEGVDLAYCSELNRYLEEKLGDEDYSLEVGSVCLTDPFKSRLQYQKNIGHDVKVLTKAGEVMYGRLMKADEEAFEIEKLEKVKVDGKKRPQEQCVTMRLGYSDVQYTKYELKV